MRLIMFGDLALTGFGTVTADLGRALLDRGVDVRFISSNDIPELPEPFASRTLDLTTYVMRQPDQNNIYGGIEPSLAWLGALTGEQGSCIYCAGNVPLVRDGGAWMHLEVADAENAEDEYFACKTLRLVGGGKWGSWKPDAAFLLGDFYGVRLMAGPIKEIFETLPAFHYVPIEGHDLPRLWGEMWEVIKPLAMSEFGRREIAKVVGYQPPLLYHGVDTDAFYPITPSHPQTLATKTPVTLTSKEQCKRFFGFNPAARIILRCDTNMPRKGYPWLLRTLESTLIERPDTLMVFKTAAFGEGCFLPDVISKMQPEAQKRVVVLDMKQLPRPGLNALYNAADLYVSCSAEGFGLTLAEAIACGVPAVGIDYSSVPEVIGPAGKTVPVGNVWDNPYGHFWAFPDPDQFARTVAYLLDHPARARELGNAGPAHVHKTFDWGNAADVLIGVLNERVKADTREMVAA